MLNRLLVIFNKLIVLSITCATISIYPSLAQTQAGQRASNVLEEIIVTARKREESLQDTPLAVSAFDAKSLLQRNITSLDELGQYAPNVQFDSSASESGGMGSQIAIRGIGQTDYVVTVEPGVGLYLDGVYIGKSAGSQIDNIGIDRVEILRGPQGTLFGKNTIGGAISVWSKRPGDEVEASLDVTAGNYDRLDVKASVSGPLTDNFRLQLTAASQSREGHVTRNASAFGDGQKEGNVEILYGRVVAELDITEDFLATARFDYTRSNEQANGRILFDVNEAALFPSLHNGIEFPACAPGVDPARFTNPDCFNSQWETSLDSLQNNGRGPNFSDSDVWGASLTLDWDMGNFNIKSITAFRRVDIALGQDLTPNGAQYFDYNFHDLQMENTSQEFQLTSSLFDNRLEYLIGLFYLNEDGCQSFGVVFDPLEIVSGGCVDNTSLAAFAQGTYDITDRLALTAGFRYTDDETRFRPGASDTGPQSVVQVFNPILTVFIPSVVPGAPLLPFVFVEDKFSDFSPTVTLSYDLSDEILTYFSYSQGFKSGGFTMRSFPPIIPGVTTPITDPKLIIPSFAPEEVEVFEFGAKSELFDQRMRLNVAAFITNYDNVQLLSVQGVGGLVPVTINAGDARIWGVEVESEMIISSAIRMNAGFSWLDNKYLSVSGADGITIDDRLANAPKWTATAGATIDIMRNEHGYVYLRGDWSHKASQFKEAKNDPRLLQSSYDLVHASISWESVDQHWRATFGGTNLTDEIYMVSGIENGGTGLATATPSRDREWYFRINYEF